MYRIACLIMLVVILIAGVPAMPATADTIKTVFDSDSEICAGKGGAYNNLGDSYYCAWIIPDGKVHDMVIFAHGYVDPIIPNGAIPWDQLTLTTPSLPEILLGMNYGFAIPSYSKNGLAVQEGVTAVWDLANEFKKNPLVGNIFLVGASEGGLVTNLAIEKKPDPGKVNPFSGGVTTCGPVGDFQKQINYWGDFRVAFDYFFRNTQFIKGFQFSPVFISEVDYPAMNPPYTSTMTLWRTGLLKAAIVSELQLPINAQAIKDLLAASKAPIDPKNPTITTGETILGLLDYNIKATNEARIKLSKNTITLDQLAGNIFQPFDNKWRWYFGSSEDAKLNQWVTNTGRRFSTTSDVVSEIAKYQTTGKIKAPLVALHTTGDPIVPFWHEMLYQVKIWQNGNGAKFFSIPVARYGHCNFTAQEAIFAFAVMVYKATGQLPPLPKAPQSDTDVLTQQDYNDMLKQYEPKMIFIPMVSQ